MKSRKELPSFLLERGLTNIGVEVGVCEGSFSEHILENWTGKLLYSVDPWAEQLNVRLDVSNISQAEQDLNYIICRDRLKRFRSRSWILRLYSLDAAQQFHDNDLDFVYIDARHDYRSVANDIRAWWPKIRSGGLLSGHDYKNSFVRKNLVEVKTAVDNFALEYGVEVHSTTEDNLPSWYIFKP